MTHLRITSTPWGRPDYCQHIAEGITVAETPSHGGIILSAERAQALEAMFPDFRPFTGTWRALEEDCDAALVVIAWPEHFEPRRVSVAAKGVATLPYFEACRPFFRTVAGLALLAEAGVAA